MAKVSTVTNFLMKITWGKSKIAKINISQKVVCAEVLVPRIKKGSLKV